MVVKNKPILVGAPIKQKDVNANSVLLLRGDYDVVEKEEVVTSSARSLNINRNTGLTFKRDKKCKLVKSHTRMPARVLSEKERKVRREMEEMFDLVHESS